MFGQDTRARSRLLGAIQLVCLVMLLSSVLGLGIYGVVGGLAQTVPATNFEFDYDDSTETLVITHAGGDTVDARAIRFTGLDAECTADDWGGRKVSAGDTCRVDSVPADTELRVAWDGVGTNTATLGGWAGPDA
jgi:hypothetical protein